MRARKFSSKNARKISIDNDPPRIGKVDSSEEERNFKKQLKREGNEEILFPFSEAVQPPHISINSVSEDFGEQPAVYRPTYKIVLNKLENLLVVISKSPELSQIVFSSNGRNAGKLHQIYKQIKTVISLARQKLSPRECVHMRYLNKLNYLKMRHFLPYELWRQINDENIRIKSELLKYQPQSFVEETRKVEFSILQNFQTFRIEDVNYNEGEDCLQEESDNNNMFDDNSLLVESQFWQMKRKESRSVEIVERQEESDLVFQEEGDQQEMYGNYSQIFANSSFDEIGPVLEIVKVYEVSYHGKGHKWKKEEQQSDSEEEKSESGDGSGDDDLGDSSNNSDGRGDDNDKSRARKDVGSVSSTKLKGKKPDAKMSKDKDAGEQLEKRRSERKKCTVPIYFEHKYKRIQRMIDRRKTGLDNILRSTMMKIKNKNKRVAAQNPSREIPPNEGKRGTNQGLTSSRQRKKYENKKQSPFCLTIPIRTQKRRSKNLISSVKVPIVLDSQPHQPIRVGQSSQSSQSDAKPIDVIDAERQISHLSIIEEHSKEEVVEVENSRKKGRKEEGEGRRRSNQQIIESSSVSEVGVVEIQ